MPNDQPSESAKKQLLANVYAGSNMADHCERDQEEQGKYFKDMPISQINLLEEFVLENNFNGVSAGNLLTHIINAYNIPALRWALQQQPTIVNHYFDGEQHPLLLAAELGFTDMVAMLIAAGADPNLMAYKKSPADSRLQAPGRSFAKNHVSHDTVAAAIQANQKIKQGIKNMVSQAIVKINLQASDHKTVIFRSNRNNR